MIYISHRGNLTGKNPDKENSPEYIIKALEKGFDVEVDVWLVKKEFYLGHDKPQYPIATRILQNGKIWCHAKNIHTLLALMASNTHCFYHDTEKIALTSRGYLWTYPGEELTPASIAVLPDVRVTGAGVCSDFIEEVREKCFHT